MSEPSTIYVDAAGQIAGRLCSIIASQLLAGKRVVVINAEKALISGGRNAIVTHWKERLELSSRVNPIYGPIHPRRPDNILRRMVRGMVPKTKSKGVNAMKRLRVYIGTPEGATTVPLTKFDHAAAPRPISLYVSLGDLAKNIGWSG